MNSAEKITLRPVEGADEEFLLSVYTCTREQELAQVPWTLEQKAVFLKMQFTAQKNHYAAEYPAASHEIICVNEVPVGRLYLERGSAAFHILDVTVLPQFRNAGIGTSLLQQILAEAGQSGKPITVYVESFNPSQGLFGKLGFQRVSENGLHWLLRWSPATV